MYLLHNTFNASLTDLFYKVILLILGQMLLNYSLTLFSSIHSEISLFYCVNPFVPNGNPLKTSETSGGRERVHGLMMPQMDIFMAPWSYALINFFKNIVLVELIIFTINRSPVKICSWSLSAKGNPAQLLGRYAVLY